MKIIASIFIIVALSLSFVPCADDLEKVKTEVQQSDDFDHPDHSEDDCTPFCSCACCGSAIIFEIVEIEEKGSVEIFSEYQSDYTPTHATSYHAPIWHPPTMS